MEDAKTKADDTPPICNTTDAGQDEELRQGFAPQPAASDVPHDVVRAQRAVQALGALLSRKPHSRASGLADHYFEWVQSVEKVHADIRDALATPAPSTSTAGVVKLDDADDPAKAAYVAGWQTRQVIDGAEIEALRAENARLRAALEVISNRPIPDQPATAPGDELSWAQRQYAQLRSIALSALSR